MKRKYSSHVKATPDELIQLCFAIAQCASDLEKVSTYGGKAFGLKTQIIKILKAIDQRILNIAQRGLRK